MSKDLIAEGSQYFQNKQYEKSLAIFNSLFNKTQNHVNAFNCAATFIKLKQYKNGIDKYKFAIKNHELDVNKLGYSIHNMRFMFSNFLIEENYINLAFEELYILSEVFIQHVIIDTHFLLMRGIPDFLMYLDILKSIQDKVDSTKFASLINSLKKGLDKDGNFFIHEIIEKENQLIFQFSKMILNLDIAY